MLSSAVLRAIRLIFCCLILTGNLLTKGFPSDDADDKRVSTEKPSYKYTCKDNFDVALGKTNPDASPPNTTLSSKIVSLLDNFAALSTGMGHPWTEEKRENYMRVLKMELFTQLAKNRFVLPAGDEETEKSLLNKMKTFAAKWYDLGQAQAVDEELHKEMQSTVKHFISLGKTLTVEDLYKKLLQNYAIVKEPQHPMTIVKAKVYQPKVYFPLEDLVVEHKNVSRERVAAWTSNFHVRKFLIHEQFLWAAKKPRMVAFDYRERHSTYDVTVRSIMEMAPYWKELRCTYTGVLNEFARNFEAQKYPRELMRTFKDKLLEVVKADSKIAQDLQRRYDGIMSDEHESSSPSSILSGVHWPVDG